MSQAEPYRSILHIGAPKCGSSALQTALSHTPRLRARDGRRYEYVSGAMVQGRWLPLRGRVLSQRAAASPYGYVAGTGLSLTPDTKPFFDQLHTLMTGKRRGGRIPILSNEGWIIHPDLFAQHLDTKRTGPVAVLAYVRPPLEWLNAAYWQWGVWSGLSFDVWLERSQLSYQMGTLLTAWSKIPNLHLRIRSARQDVVADFADFLDAPLPRGAQTNTTSVPSLIGFLMRNRHFRRDWHDSKTEFVFQRWCPQPDEPKLWAVLARNVHSLRSPMKDEVQRLLALMPDTEREALLNYPGWTRERHYHPLILEGISGLNRPEAKPGLYRALCIGLEAASEAAGQKMPALPSCPAESADVATWDEVIATLLTALIEADEAWRKRRSLLLRLGMLTGLTGPALKAETEGPTLK